MKDFETESRQAWLRNMQGIPTEADEPLVLKILGAIALTLLFGLAAFLI